MIFMWYVATHLMAHGWRDIAVGSNYNYCGFEYFHHAFNLYCQRGE
jgi:hypothetical protein